MDSKQNRTLSLLKKTLQYEDSSEVKVIKMSILILYSSDGKLLEEWTASICKGVAITNCKSGNFGALIRNFLVPTTELKISVHCDE